MKNEDRVTKEGDLLQLAVRGLAQRKIHPAVAFLLAGAVALSSPEVRKHLRGVAVEGAATLFAAQEALLHFGRDMSKNQEEQGTELITLPDAGPKNP